MANTDLLLLGPGEFSFGFRAQADLVTAAATGTSADWTWLDAVAPSLGWNYETGAEQKSSGQRGANARKGVGPKTGTLSFRVELPGQAADHDATSDTPVDSGPWELLMAAIGETANGTYAAAAVEASPAPTANGFTLASGTVVVGAAYAFGASPTAIRGIFFVEALNTLAVTMRCDARAIPVAGDNLYPLLTAAPAPPSSTPVYTFRLVGELAAIDFRYVGAVLSKATITWDAAGSPFCDLEFTVYAGDARGDDGGLRTVADLLQIDEYSGRGNAHLAIGQTVLTALDDGAADGGVCGTNGHSLAFEFPHRRVTCPGAEERVGAVVLRAPMITVSFTVDFTPDWDDSDGANLFVAAWRNQTPVPYQLSVGKHAGQMLAVSLPAALVDAAPGEGPQDGAWGYQVTLTAGPYTGDGASTGLGNRPAAVAVG